MEEEPYDPFDELQDIERKRTDAALAAISELRTSLAESGDEQTRLRRAIDAIERETAAMREVMAAAVTRRAALERENAAAMHALRQQERIADERSVLENLEADSALLQRLTARARALRDTLVREHRHAFDELTSTVDRMNE